MEASLLQERQMTSNARRKRHNKDPRPAPPRTAPERGCAPSFLSQKMNQEGICELNAEQQRDQYVLPDSEKEVGGEA